MRATIETTLARPVALAGVGVHSGEGASAVLRPAPAGAGIAFHRMEPGSATPRAIIPALLDHVSDTRLSTTLASGGVSVGTVEHLLAALTLCGVDNAVIEIDACEAPILDGSAAPIVEAIEAAGLRVLGAPRQAIRILKPVEIAEGARMIRIEPDTGRRLHVAIRYEDPAIGAQEVMLDLDRAGDRRRIARARTFCRLADVEALRAAGFSRGGSLENAIVVSDGAILNEGGLRDPAEFALHKALDLVGDLALAGAPIIGRITAERPGHDLNLRFLKAVIADRTAFERLVPAPPAAAVNA